MILITGKNKWFKNLMRKHKYLELMKQRGWELQVTSSYNPVHIADRYTTIYEFCFKKDDN